MYQQPRCLMAIRVLIIICVAGMLASCGGQSQNQTARGLLTGCGIPLQLDVMYTPEMRARGLMHVTSIPDGYGMAFVWPQPTMVAFWMKETRIPLDVVFFDDSQRILDIVSMQPYDETSHASHVPIQLAIEVPQGHFASYGVQVGDQCQITLPDVLVE